MQGIKQDHRDNRDRQRRPCPRPMPQSVSPVHWSGECPVEVIDEAVEPLDQLLLRFEAGTGKAAPFDDSEDDFDLVQPRAVLGPAPSTGPTTTSSVET